MRDKMVWDTYIHIKPRWVSFFADFDKQSSLLVRGKKKDATREMDRFMKK